MRPPQAINWFRIAFLQVSCSGVLYFFFGWIGFIIGISIAIILNMIIFSVLGMRYWNNCRKLYDSLISNNYTKEEALTEISKRAHPEFHLRTHRQIINKFNDIDFLVNFITGALPGDNKTDDEFALEILDDTSIQYFGGDRYKVITKRKRNKPTGNSIVTHQAKSDDIYNYLKYREHWKELNDAILENLSKIFDGDFSSFKDFVNISEHYNLLKKNYLELAKGINPKEIIPYFALTLEKSGKRLMEFFSKKSNEDYKIDAKKCYELSIKLRKNGDDTF